MEGDGSSGNPANGEWMRLDPKQAPTAAGEEGYRHHVLADAADNKAMVAATLGVSTGAAEAPTAAERREEADVMSATLLQGSDPEVPVVSDAPVRGHQATSEVYAHGFREAEEEARQRVIDDRHA